MKIDKSKKTQVVPGPFTWSNYLANNPTKKCVSVENFAHCFMSEAWLELPLGMTVEVLNRITPPSPLYPGATFYWIATLIDKAGYYGRMRYVGLEGDERYDFWVRLTSLEIYPVGHCSTYDKMLVPPPVNMVPLPDTVDWKEYAAEKLLGSVTIPDDFREKVKYLQMQRQKLTPGMTLEVVDKLCLCRMRVAKVKDVIGGRLHLEYCASASNEGAAAGSDFWCDQRSPLVHPVGWATSVGHELDALPQYVTRCKTKVAKGQYDPNDCTPELIPQIQVMEEGRGDFKANMKLEAIDPLNLSTIGVATVMKVLKNGYLMIGIDGCMSPTGEDLFCYHASSPCIFPMGFSEQHNLPLSPPRGYRRDFKWKEYVQQAGAEFAQVRLFNTQVPDHGFQPGMKLEAVDLMEPRLICVATVAEVLGRLVKIHFDGWESSYDQWVDCQSPDIYPVGWCESVGYKLEGPRREE